MTKRTEVLPWRSPTWDAYAEVAYLAEIAARQECGHCGHSSGRYGNDDDCDPHCITNKLKKALEKVKEMEEARSKE